VSVTLKPTTKTAPDEIPSITETYFGHIRHTNGEEPFRLDPEFLAKYADKHPDFGFNGLGEFVFYRTYSRTKADGTKESFLDTICRVVEGCYEIQRRHNHKIHIPWNYDKAQKSAQEMFTRMWEFKFLPPGRGLWMMGTEFMWERGSAALNNCGFVSTDDEIESDPAEPFCFLMDMSMLGVGVGFDTKGAGKIKIEAPARKPLLYTIHDSREGWVDSVRVLIWSYTKKHEMGYVEFNYDEIRKAGSDIKGFGGKASGPSILHELHELIRDHLDRCVGHTLSSVDIADLMNYIGRCVVAGNVRRTAEIAFGDPHDTAYCSMKNPLESLLESDYELFHKVTGYLYSQDRTEATLEDFRYARTLLNSTGLSERGDLCIPEDRLAPAISTWNALNHHRWASNNSIFAYVGMDYESIGRQIASNGEPGLMWLDNMRDYGRMIDGKQPGIDGRVKGGNPCLEQSLESYELCNLVETFPANHTDADDYMRTLKFAYLYAKTVTLLPTHNPRTNQVTLRNRRIGLSQSGIVQAFAKFGRRTVLNDFCDVGYNEIRRWDEIYSEWLCVQKSIKVTSVKPSGTVSLVAGATPGIHYPEASTYWRRVRVAKNSPLLPILEHAGFHIESDFKDQERTVVVRFGISDESVRPVSEISIWEQMVNVVDYQRYWADNQVSCTIKFAPEEAGEIAHILETFEDQLKGISFLPISNHGYVQAPYEPCAPAEVEKYNANIRMADYSDFTGHEAEGSKFCDSDKCIIG
jgi:adenosylcobalamin-dependent ribonucleoside-triphosphate reductase